MSGSPRRVAVVLVDRANYGRLHPVMREIQGSPELELLTIVSGSMLLEKHGLAIRTVIADGFSVDAEAHIELAGSYPVTMAKSVGIAVLEFANVLNLLRPDVVLLIGDRFETLAAAIAAAYQNIPIAHIQGGEVSGSIDESARHAISKFAQFHFPSTRRSADYLVRMGERPEHVHMTGCPCGDVLLALDEGLPADVFEAGVGARIDPEQPYHLVIFHPVTTSYGRGEQQVERMLDAARALERQTVWLWPNIDAGADHISKVLRKAESRWAGGEWLRLVKGFSPEVFGRVLKRAALALGNSSSFVRDSSFLGTPVVLVGDRQQGREVGENVVPVPCETDAIVEAAKRQLAHGRYAPSQLYGAGDAAAQITEHLSNLEPYLQKRLAYPEELA